jgi:DNA-binding response OmpR family regulator
MEPAIESEFSDGSELPFGPRVSPRVSPRVAPHGEHGSSSDLVLHVATSDRGAERLVRALANGTHQFTISAVDGSVAVNVRLSTHQLELTDSCGQGEVVVNWNRMMIGTAFGCTQLSPTELRLLASLMQRKGVAIEKTELVKSTWPHIECDGDAKNLLAVYVHSLRRRLRAIGAARVLETVRGVGYRIRP